MSPVGPVLQLLEQRGHAAYLGERVSQKEHALQTASIAVRDGATPALIAAALLHDIGHLLEGHQRHEENGVEWLANYFGSEVTEPIRLHVIAKRYLCAAERGYLARLSPASLASLELQGGPLTTEQVQEFQQDPFWKDAVRLRRWDDDAKIPGLPVAGTGKYENVLCALLRHR